MNDKKLTDAEVIKVLEDCFYKDHKFVTTYDGKTQTITEVTMQDIIDVFNRQKAEIERLKRHNNILVNRVSRRNSEIERLKKFALIRAFDRFEKETKAEAYKEFAERLKEKAYTYSDITGYQSTVVDVCEIDGVYEELVGEEK